MIYINPIEILELQDEEVNTLDSNLIKKAKRRLFADIELSDHGHLDYKGIKLTKSDCEAAIDQLEDKNKLEFFNHLASNKQLNEFLVNGNQDLLTSFKHESIYSLPEFIDFVSPYFSVKLDRVLLKAFQKNDLEIFRSALRTESLLKQSDINNTYKSISTEIQSRISEVDKITQSIKEETSYYTSDDIHNVIGIVKKHFPIDLLNCLPIYFQSQINKIASSINFLQLSIWNEFADTAVPLSLLEYLLQLNIESVSKPTFEKNHGIIKKKHQDRIEQQKNAPLLKKWAGVLISIQSKVKSIEDKSLKAAPAFNFVKGAFALNELNELPPFANEIRNQIGYSIRSMSIASWNEQNDMKSALSLINLALLIDLSEQVSLDFIQDKKELEELQKNNKGILVCHFCEKNAPDVNSKIAQTIYKETNRTWFPRRVEYTYSEISIPRCKSCEKIHTKGGQQFFTILIGSGIGGVIIGAIIDEHFIIGGILGVVIGWFSGLLAQGVQSKNQGIKDDSESTLAKHPLLIERVRAGWTFSQPTA
jgi:hypothetical protein